MGFAPGRTNQVCSGDESLATCVWFDRLRIWPSYLPIQKQTSYFYYLLMLAEIK